MTQRIFHGQDWFSIHIPVWEEFVLPNLPSNVPIHALEIGSFEGRSACWILDNIIKEEYSTLTCVDTWDGTDPALGQATLEAEKAFNHNTREYGRKVKKYKKSSLDFFLYMLPVRRHVSYGLIYIDGNHEGLCCLTDLILSWHLLNVGGILIMDDYRLVNNSFSTLPKDAWESFERVKPNMEVLHSHRQQIVRKIG